ncbi:hypothetical protein ACIPPJ_30665 [Streptomyces sp. NPDC086091]|uniref:hypothetical protein n=1 Tax=Streptomyces sp. NPDC086091 TaxID=3365751 RepID=UPI00380087B2
MTGRLGEEWSIGTAEDGRGGEEGAEVAMKRGVEVVVKRRAEVAVTKGGAEVAVKRAARGPSRRGGGHGSRMRAVDRAVDASRCRAKGIRTE